MSTQKTTCKADFYEGVISKLCTKAQASGGYNEGKRDEDGTPLGMTLWAIHAKWLYRFQKDGVMLIPLEDAENAEKVFLAAANNYKVIDPDKMSGDFMSHYGFIPASAS